jgi:hypothetical protein
LRKFSFCVYSHSNFQASSRLGKFDTVNPPWRKGDKRIKKQARSATRVLCVQ